MLLWYHYFKHTHLDKRKSYLLSVHKLLCRVQKIDSTSCLCIYLHIWEIIQIYENDEFSSSQMVTVCILQPEAITDDHIADIHCNIQVHTCTALSSCMFAKKVCAFTNPVLCIHPSPTNFHNRYHKPAHGKGN